jgi:hypothetical protein
MSIAKAMRLSVAQAPYRSSVVEAIPAAPAETKRRASLLASAVRKSNFGQTLRKTLSEATGLRSVAFEEDLQARPYDQEHGASFEGVLGLPPSTSALERKSVAYSPVSERSDIGSPDPHDHPQAMSLGFSSAPVVQASEVRLLHKARPSVKFHEVDPTSGDAQEPAQTLAAFRPALLPRRSTAGARMSTYGGEPEAPSLEKQLAQKRASLRPARNLLLEEANENEMGEDVPVTGFAAQLKTEITKRHSIKIAQRVAPPPPPPPSPPPPGPRTRTAAPPPPPPPPGKQVASKTYCDVANATNPRTCFLL